MINLISQRQKKIIFQEYLIRLISVLLFILSLLSFLTLAYILPYYFTVLRNDLVVSEQLQSIIKVENKENQGDNINLIVNQTNDQIRSINSLALNENTFSLLISKIMANKSNEIKLNHFAFQVTDLDSAKLIASGVAKNRQSLVEFVDDLKKEDGIVSVDSPISDFAKESNITFTVNIKTQI